MDFPETPAAENPNHVPAPEVPAEADAPAATARRSSEAPVEAVPARGGGSRSSARSLLRRLPGRLNPRRPIRAKKRRASRGSASAM